VKIHIKKQIVFFSVRKPVDLIINSMMERMIEGKRGLRRKFESRMIKPREERNEKRSRLRIKEGEWKRI